ncbi:hypothetical protein ACIBQ1_58375 [Nonomuraea sp. NPDC050153]|uniref:hypothetical protein n=1 Tax=Nonomuraea sp. NPDC050153 TaxID=3364359 RepID=UPI00379AE8FE
MSARLDGPVARTALITWHLFVASACFLVCCAPYFLFERLIGWQPSHGALWLGALSLMPVGPALRGLLATVHAMVSEGRYPGRPVGRFVGAIRRSSRGLRMLWWSLPALALLLAYDVALYGGTNSAVPVLAGTVGMLLGLILIGATVVDTRQRGLAVTLRIVLESAARRPHIPLAWLFLLLTAVLVANLPLVGPSLLLFVPAAWATAVDVVNRSWQFAARAREKT